MYKFLTLFLILGSLQAKAVEFAPYLGIHGGFNSAKGDQNESDKSGPSVGAKILGSWEFDSIYFDIGGGWQMMQLKGDGITIDTKTGFGEIDLRYKLSQSWSLGPAVRVLSGTDNTNAEWMGESSVTSQVMAKLMYQTKWGSLPARIELAAGPTVGLDRQMVSGILGIQIGWPRSEEKKTSGLVAPTPPVVPQKVREYVVVLKEEAKPDLTVDLKMARIRFDVDKSDISSVDEKKLQRLASFLRDNDSQWERIKIGGHTDITGDANHNKKLSQDRADAVMAVFAKYGVNESKMSANGYGSSVPVDDRKVREAYNKNRRTEIEFFGVKNRDLFNRKLIESLK